MALKGKGKRALQAAADSCEVFRHETLSARYEQGRPFMGWGQLPGTWADALSREIERDGQCFVVYSYSTPIAWRSATGWFMPPVKYSVTTTNHQNVLATAIAHPSFYASARW